MRKRFFVSVVSGLFIFSIIVAGASANDKEARSAIEKVIQEAYIDGIHNNPDADKIRQGFHSGFTMLYVRDGALNKITRDEWIDRIEQGKKRNGDKPRPETTYEMRHIDVAGNSAVAALDVFKDGKHVYTDYMSLYEFEDGWKIVNKIFYSHK